jgi:uroporphyrinogen decarboxylase
VTSRERIHAAIHFQGPDRCPVKHYMFPGVFWRHGRRALELAQRYPDDFGNRMILDNFDAAEKAGARDAQEVIEWKDPWGVRWRRLGGYTAGDVVAPAIADWDAWPEYQFPPPPDERRFEDFAAQASTRRATEYIHGGGGSLFQHLQHLRGPANMLMDVAEDNEGINELADRMVDYMLVSVRGYLAAGADGIGFGDDLGAPDRLLVHPDTWRRFFKPRYARLFAPVLEAGKDVWFHSDGWILEIIEDLIEIGVKLLNPQHEIMDTWRVGEIVRGRICVCTDLDRQGTIPFGTPERIAQETRRAIAAFSGTRNGRDGGVMLHGEIGPDVPLGNIEALYSSFYRLGRYPLEWLPGYLREQGRVPASGRRR